MTKIKFIRSLNWEQLKDSQKTIIDLLKPRQISLISIRTFEASSQGDGYITEVVYGEQMPEDGII